MPEYKDSMMTIEDLVVIVTMVCTVTGMLTIMCTLVYFMWN